MGFFEDHIEDGSVVIVATMCLCRLQSRGTGEDPGIQVSDDVDLKHSADHLSNLQISRHVLRCF